MSHRGIEIQIYSPSEKRTATYAGHVAGINARKKDETDRRVDGQTPD